MPEEKDLADALAAAFAVVVAKARTDKAFARQLADALGEAAAHPAAKASEAPNIDPRAIVARGGADALRAALAPLDRKSLQALVRARNLSPAGTAKFNKAQLIEHILLATKPARGARRVFDY